MRRGEENARLAIPSCPTNLKRVALMEFVGIHVSLFDAGFKRGGVVRGRTTNTREHTQVRRATGAGEGYLLTSRLSADLNSTLC